MNKKTFYIFLSLFSLLSLFGGWLTFFSFTFFSISIVLFVRWIEKKQVPVEQQVLFFFSFAALTIILSKICASLCIPEPKTSLPSSMQYFVEGLIFLSAILAGAIFIAISFKAGGKASSYFLVIGLFLICAAAVSGIFSYLLAIFFFLYGISRGFIDWLPQRFKFWLFIGIAAGWAYIISMERGIFLHPAWAGAFLQFPFYHSALLPIILAVSIAFALYLLMSLIMGSRKTRTKTVTSYVLLSIVPITILLIFLWMNFYLQIGIFQLYVVWKENIDLVNDLATTFSEEIDNFIKSRNLSDRESASLTKILCQKYEDFLSLTFTKPSAFVTIFPPDSDKPIIQVASKNASLIDPSANLYPEWIKNQSIAWVFLENGKLLLKAEQFNNFGGYRAYVRLYVPFEFQNLQDFEKEYRLSIHPEDLTKAPPPAIPMEESRGLFSFADLQTLINEGKISLPAINWESGNYVRAGTIEFSSPRFLFQEEGQSPLYSFVLLGIPISSTIIIFIVIIVSTILGYIINSNMRRSFNAIVDGAHRFSSGDFDYRISLMSKDEYSIIGGALNQMAIGIKQYTEEMIKKELMERELSIASEVQKRIFPQSPPSLHGFGFGIVNKPYGKVAGDYYDFIEYPDGDLAVVVADASGKGIPAALLVSSLNAILHSYSKPDRLADLLSAINARLREVSTENAYITLVFCLLNRNGSDIRYVNAGHPYPLLLNGDGQFSSLHIGGTSLGMIDMIELREGAARMESGDVLVFVTDGILETTNSSGEEFQFERLKESIKEYRLGTAQEIADGIFEKLKAFSASEQFADDATCIVIKKL